MLSEIHLATFCSLDRNSFLKVKQEEWGGVFIDLLEEDELIEKSVVKAEFKEIINDCDNMEWSRFQFSLLCAYYLY